MNFANLLNFVRINHVLTHPRAHTPHHTQPPITPLPPQSKARVNVAFWGGLVPGNAHDAPTLTALLDAGAVGFKAFLSPSGINDFPNVSAKDVAAAVEVLGPKGAPLMAHAELVTHVEEEVGGWLSVVERRGQGGGVLGQHAGRLKQVAVAAAAVLLAPRYDWQALMQPGHIPPVWPARSAAQRFCCCLRRRVPTHARSPRG